MASGYQSETEFLIKEDGRERKRWRVCVDERRTGVCHGSRRYTTLTVGSLMPAFQSIVNSFTLTESGKAEGAQRLRQRSAQGEVVETSTAAVNSGFRWLPPETGLLKRLSMAIWMLS